MDNLLKYKQISLADFIVNNYGFYKAQGSSPSSPKLTNGDTTVVVGKRNETYYYFDVHDSENKGTIIDFVQNFEGEQNIGKIIKMLDNYNASDIKEIVFDIDGSNEKDISKFIDNLKDNGNTDYLTNRGISLRTIKLKIFSNVIKFSPLPHSNVTDIAFRMHSDDSSVNAISYRGIRTNEENKEPFNFKGFIGRRSRCLAMAFTDRKLPFDNIYIGESFIDCLSHYELNNKKLENKNIAYISTEGSIQPYQANLLSNIIQNQQIKKISIISDNDLYGSQFAAYAMGKMRVANNLEKTENNCMLNLFQINVPIIGKKQDNAFISFNYSENFNLEKQLNYITNKVNSFDYVIKNSFKFEIKHDKSATANNIVVSFPNNTLAWNECFKLINDIKFCSSELFSRIRPIAKDFNQDLQDSIEKNKSTQIQKEKMASALTSKFM